MQEPSVVQSIRLPRKIWDELQKRAELNERSFNFVVLKLIQAQLEQEKQEKEEVGA